MATTIFRGFKVSVATLDAFLRAHGVKETLGLSQALFHHPGETKLSRLLYSILCSNGGHATNNNVRVMIPSRSPHHWSNVAYVTYTWMSIYAHRQLRLDEDLPIQVPAGFEALQDRILSFCHGIAPVNKIEDEGMMGLFAVHDEIQGMFVPEELNERKRVPQYCDQCPAMFYSPASAYIDRQDHREVYHGAIEGRSPVPEV
ncbi:hypothetical protein PT974_05152 [Cladobotryum mycophilum]|uniref:C2H2-type domain-containing protein n=1 Tax=Cladobotryum mycophilum TaxID=491253 RepID=A0ABR0SRW2_9HYPO